MKTTGTMAAVAGGLLAGALAWTAAARPAAQVNCRVELDRGILPAGSAQRAVVKVTLEAPPPPEKSARPPVNLALVIDRSGSMGGEKIQRAKEAAVEALRRLAPDDIISVVVYDHEVETVVPAQRAANAEWIEGRIRAIQSRGNTALFAGVSQGASEVRKHLEGRFVHRVILLSDGLANVGPADPGDLGRLGAALVKEHISVSTVGVGTDYNEDLMTKLSQNSDGNAYFVENSRDLPRIFAAELGDVLSIAARKVMLEIEFPEGTRPVRLVGRDGRIDGQRVEISLNQLYGGQAKFALVEVDLPAGRSKEQRTVASARCAYENVFNQCAETATGRCDVQFSESESEIAGSQNRAVQKDYIVNDLAETKNKAIELNDSGRNREAAQILRTRQQDLEKKATEFKMLDAVQDDLGRAGAAASKMEENDFRNVDRKAMRTDNYQIFNQQQRQ